MPPEKKAIHKMNLWFWRERKTKTRENNVELKDRVKD